MLPQTPLYRYTNQLGSAITSGTQTNQTVIVAAAVSASVACIILFILLIMYIRRRRAGDRAYTISHPFENHNANQKDVEQRPSTSNQVNTLPSGHEAQGILPVSLRNHSSGIGRTSHRLFLGKRRPDEAQARPPQIERALQDGNVQIAARSPVTVISDASAGPTEQPPPPYDDGS